ncbi:MAG: hypothetical protein EPN21_16075 [Methylococcaceae bacterium]|nr:MAG: hypothetical protein EPN21_16075 [Methylococcaceae bacterium]
MKQLDLSQARTAVQTGGILAADLRPAGSRFYVEFETRSGPALLVTTNTRKPRPFSPLKAFETVRELGLAGGRYSLVQWQPETANVDRRPRPDRKAAMQRSREAVQHDAWFREQVAAGLASVEAGDTQPFDAFRRELEAELAA